MAKLKHRLTVLKVDRETKPGMYADGDGLYLRVTPGGSKNWVFRFMLNGKPHYMGLGPVSLFGLGQARAKALDARRLRHDGLNPIEARQAAKRKALLDEAKTITFKECSALYIAAQKAGWRNAKHASQVSATLAAYADPVFGSLPVQSVDTALVTKALGPIWATKPETAGRVRGRIERILDLAKARGYREGDNPARWRGHLDQLLPRRSKVRDVVHHPALPFAEIPAFMADLRAQAGIAARALEFTILSAARSGGVLGAPNAELDASRLVWSIPATRMKARRDHRVPLCGRAQEVCAEMAQAREDGKIAGPFIFPGQKKGKGLSNMALTMTLRRMGREDITTHGFRSTFRDWAAECTNFPSEVVEMALAHVIKDQTEAAYRRGDLFEKRRELMRAWDDFCSGRDVAMRNGGKIISIHGRR